MALATTLSPALTARVALMGRRVQAPRAAARPRPLAAGRRALVTTATFTKVGTKAELDAAGGRLVVETEFAGKLLIQDFMGDIFAISNKCPHLGISMQGKTPVLSAEMKDDGVIVCPAHKSSFDIKTGEPMGEWCPGMPSLPFVGKPMTGDPKPIPVYEVRVSETGDIEVDC